MKQGTSFKSQVFSSLIWKFFERTGTQVVQLVIQIILARILSPDDFGIITIIVVFTTLAGVFVQSGFNTALIQKKEVDELDFSTVFYVSLAIATLFYFILYFSAPYIAVFFKEQELQPILRVLSVILFLGVLNSIQNAVIARNMQFKKLFFSSLGGIVFAGIIGIILAYKGFGVWALVYHQIIKVFSVTTILWFTVKWRPKWIFSISRVKLLFDFGWKMLLTSLIYSLYMNLRSLVIGRMFTSDLLGFYSRGEQFPSLIVTNIDGSIQSVLFPALSSQQENIPQIKKMVRRTIVTSTFLIFPLMFGLAVIAEPLVKILLTDKWLPSVPFLQIFCFIYALWPIHTVNLQAINAIGRSDISLKLQIIKRAMDIVILVITVFFGIYAILLGALFSGIISTFINAYPNKKLINYSYKDQFRDIIPSLLIASAMGAIIFCIKYIKIGLYNYS